MNAKRDQNDHPVDMEVSSVDNITPLMLRVDPITSYLLIQEEGTSTLTGVPKHRIDENDIPTSYGVSDSDGTTLIPIQTDSEGRLLIQYN